MFAQFYTDRLNTRNEVLKLPTTALYIPVLDNPITNLEVFEAIKSLKMDSAAGIDGLFPGYMKFLTDEWIIMITEVFNTIFWGELP